MEMYEKKEKIDYIWVIPLVAGFCAIIAVLAPTAYFSYVDLTWNWWMWNLTVLGAVGYDSVSLFVSEIDFIVPAIIATSAILLSAVNLFILSNTTRKNKLNTKNFTLMSAISAVLSIGIMVYYIIALDIAFYDGLIIEGAIFPAGYHFFDAFAPSFGIILPFISAALSFIGVGVFQYYSKRKEYIVPSRMDLVPSKLDIYKEQLPASKTMESLNFCPECGYKLLQADANFCTNCGFKFSVLDS